MADNHNGVSILCIDIERFRERERLVQREIMTRMQRIANECGKFFSPRSDPWDKWTRTPTGEVYYFVFDALPPRVALQYAYNLAAALERQTDEIADPNHRFGIRMALVYGDVKTIGGHVFSEIFGNAELLLSCQLVKQRLANGDAHSVIVMSGTFRVMWDQDNVEDGLELETAPENWSHFQFEDKHRVTHIGFILDGPLPKATKFDTAGSVFASKAPSAESGEGSIRASDL